MLGAVGVDLGLGGWRAGFLHCFGGVIKALFSNTEQEIDGTRLRFCR